MGEPIPSGTRERALVLNPPHVCVDARAVRGRHQVVDTVVHTNERLREFFTCQMPERLPEKPTDEQKAEINRIAKDIERRKAFCKSPNIEQFKK